MREELEKEIDEAEKEIDQKAKNILLPHQLQQFMKLKFASTIRSYGFSEAVSKKPFSDSLKLSKEQKEKLAKIKQETEKEIRVKAEEMRKAAKEKMLKVIRAKITTV